MEKVKEIKEDKKETKSKKTYFDDKQPSKLEKVGEFLKPNKTRILITLLFGLIGIVFQVWSYMNPCLQFICQPVILGITYYVIFPFDMLSILLIANLPPIGIVLSLIKAIILMLNIIYWYIISCLIAIPLDKKLKIRRKHKLKEKEAKEKAMKEAIAQQIKEAEEKEKQKDIERLKRNK